MLEISELIYETCKTYLITQGKFLLILWLFIAVVIVLYFGVLSPVPEKPIAITLPIILLFSLQRNVVNGIGLSGKTGKSGARVGEGVDPDAEPRHAVTAGDSNQAKEKDDGQRDSDRLWNAATVRRNRAR